MAKPFALQVLLPALVISAVIAGVFLAYRTAPVILEVVDAETGAPVPAARLYLPAGQVQTTHRDGRILTRLPRQDNQLATAAGGYIPNQTTCSPPRFRWGTYHCTVQVVPQRLTVRLADALEPTYAMPPARVTANGREAVHFAGRQYMIQRIERPAHLTIEAPGYLRWEGEVAEPAYFTGQRAFAVALQPVRIAGRVIAADSGEALAGARVWAGEYSALSDAAGAFELLRVPAPFQLRVERAGYMPYRGPLIEETWLEQPGPLEISLQPIWTAGIVRNADTHLPIAGAVIQTPLQHAESETSGAFRLRALEAGTAITITANDYFSATLVYAGQETLDIALRQIKVPVTVRDALSGQPIAGALIQTAGRMYLTDDTGYVTVIGLLPGQELEVSAPRHAVAHLVYTGGNPQEVWLAPRKVILRVVDADTGEPIPGVRLKSAGQVIPDGPAGTYLLENWNPMQSLTVRAAGYRKFTLTLTPDLWCALPTERRPCLKAVHAEDSDVVALELALPAFRAKGIYIPFGLLTQPGRLQELLELVKSTELNAVVIDMKGDRGFLGFQSASPLAQEFGALRRDVVDIRGFLRECREAGVYTIARMVVFKDNPLAHSRPEWAAVQADGSIWLDREGLGWANPFLQEVWDYNIALAKEVAELGFDEIQFDYLRFPSDGDVGATVYTQENTLETRTRAIRTFMEQMTAALEPYDVFISADVFGLTIWVAPDSDMGIGQRVKDIGPYLDYLCPMIYPSTFGPGNLGYEVPADHPYDVIYRSVIQAASRLPPYVRVRPWLQAYRYSLEQQAAQRQAAEDAGAWGWCLWNAGGKYLPELFAPAGP